MTRSNPRVDKRCVPADNVGAASLLANRGAIGNREQFDLAID
jgi:hypothetical protein